MRRSFYLTFIAVLIIAGQEAFGQKFPPLDKSPADIAYMRDGDNELVARVVYSRPQKKGRDVYSKLAPYGKIWRTGANEATEIQFFRDVNFGGETVKKGAYSLFSIPNRDKWTVILNTSLYQWGAYSYDEGKDVARVEVSEKATPKDIEAFTITFNESNMILAWGEKMVAVPISFSAE